MPLLYGEADKGECMSELFVRDHDKDTHLQLEIYGYFARLHDDKNGTQICLVCSNCDVSRIAELVNAGGVTAESILGRRLMITVEDAKP